MSTPPASEASLQLDQGWHCSHLYYSFDRAALARMTSNEKIEGARQFVEALDPARTGQPMRLQGSIVSGHKADFGLMLLDADPLRIDAVHQRLAASPLGPALLSAAVGGPAIPDVCAAVRMFVALQLKLMNRIGE
jgi:chlorite dismutase